MTLSVSRGFARSGRRINLLVVIDDINYLRSKFYGIKMCDPADGALRGNIQVFGIFWFTGSVYKTLSKMF